METLGVHSSPEVTPLQVLIQSMIHAWKDELALLPLFGPSLNVRHLFLLQASQPMLAVQYDSKYSCIDWAQMLIQHASMTGAIWWFLLQLQSYHPDRLQQSN